MNITILTLGTRCDVQPYVALAKELIKRNHHVTICTGATFESFCTQNGLTFYPSTLDFMQLIQTDEGKALFNGGKINPRQTLNFVKTIINPGYQKTFHDFYEASKQADLILSHPKALGAADVAEILNIPIISLPPVPMTFKTTELPNYAITLKNLGKTLNRLTYLATDYGEASYMKLINEFRAEHALKKRKAATRVPKHTIYPLSTAIFSDIKSWNHEDLCVSGFFFLRNQHDVLEENVSHFLNQAPSPIIITFSSMPMKAPETFIATLEEVLTKSSQRAIILSGDNEMISQHPNILIIKSAPHHLLFERARGIIHHGGVGTTAEALRSGIPQAIMPFSVDQPFWAKHLADLQLSVATLNEKTLTTDKLINVFNHFQDPAQTKRSAKIGATIQKENATATAATFIESILTK